MSEIEVRGLCRMQGEIVVQGSKNAVLPMMAASILNSGRTVLENVPRIQDVFCMMGILNSLGCVCRLTGNRMEIDASVLSGCSVEKEEMEKMRSSIMLLGALLGRLGEARLCSPGGCRIGRRPIDFHLEVLRGLGAEIEEEESGFLRARAAKLSGSRISLPFPSVGATENALFAAVMASGRTVLSGCAREPEIRELCDFLNSMGASVRGGGTSVIVVEGGLPLHNTRFVVGGDRIVAGTYLLSAVSAGGELLLTGFETSGLRAVTTSLRRMGATVYEEEELIYIRSMARPEPLSVKTGPYPAFPTDLQSVMMAVLCLARGESSLEETVFENRLGTAQELKKMGARIDCDEKKAFIFGVSCLSGTRVEAADLRGGAALITAALGAEGITRIGGCAHILRGYEDICRDLKKVGVHIRMREPYETKERVCSENYEYWKAVGDAVK